MVLEILGGEFFILCGVICLQSNIALRFRCQVVAGSIQVESEVTTMWLGSTGDEFQRRSSFNFSDFGSDKICETDWNGLKWIETDWNGLKWLFDSPNQAAWRKTNLDDLGLADAKPLSRTAERHQLWPGRGWTPNCGAICVASPRLRRRSTGK